MQISRHWRLNAVRYRLEGVQYNDGSVTLQKKPFPPETSTAVLQLLTEHQSNQESVDDRVDGTMIETQALLPEAVQ